MCRIASTINEESNGKIDILSLYDIKAQNLLLQIYPLGWTHQPYLLSIKDTGIKAATNQTLALKLGYILGPIKALKIWKMTREYGVTFPFGNNQKFSPTRRSFLRNISIVLATIPLLNYFLDDASKATINSDVDAPKDDL